ncbi:succinate dehydrogenase assembly factor 2 [Micavibrio aeruginosavorus]|uniref:succinate dehydrogenase assembly factor 2 n=1 Tax=Micavibrio aeruginosavorus TaxID=349221 RepID=UPI003F4AA852
MNTHHSEPVDDLRRRLMYQSDHRGTKEMDIILGRFARAYVQGFTESELADYAGVLQLNDVDLYNWVTGQATPPANVMTPVLQKLIDHKVSSADL